VVIGEPDTGEPLESETVESTPEVKAVTPEITANFAEPFGHVVRTFV
jgi:hypothetical protein